MLASGGRTVAEQLTHNPKFKGSNPAADKRGEKTGQKTRVVMVSRDKRSSLFSDVLLARKSKPLSV